MAYGEGSTAFLGSGIMRLGGIGGLGGIGQIAAPFLYVPDLLPVGNGASYFPRDVIEDAKALNFLGFLDDAAFAAGSGSLGSQQADIANETGAWDPGFRAAVTRYEAARDLKVDSFIGPQVRTTLAKDVLAKNAAGLPPVPVPKLPDVIIPIDPGGVPGGNKPVPGVQPKADETLLFVGIGGGILALLGVGYLVLK